MEDYLTIDEQMTYEDAPYDVDVFDFIKKKRGWFYLKEIMEENEEGDEVGG